MDSFFKDLGRSVLEQWKRENFSLPSFPEIARQALEQRPPSEHVDVAELIRDFLMSDEQPLQTMSGFGQPEVVAYDHPRFYIQLLFWLDGTTDIHQHEFSGAFHVMAGSSIHAHYEFKNARSVTPHFRVGDVCLKQIELLETGRTVPIISGKDCIHSLFHLDRPSITVVVRTKVDPGTGPQFNYLPPHIAMDPVFSDTLTMRRKQMLDMLEQTEDASYATLAMAMIEELDFERGFFILQNCMGYLHELDEWDATLAAFEARHGSLASGVAATLEEGLRRDFIKNLRSSVTEPEHGFFLALLMNVTTRADLLALVAQRFTDADPIDTVLRWAEELGEEVADNIAVLDAFFPDEIGLDLADQPDVFIAALHHFMAGDKKLPKALKPMSVGEMKLLHAAFAGSSLRVLVG